MDDYICRFDGMNLERQRAGGRGDLAEDDAGIGLKPGLAVALNGSMVRSNDDFVAVVVPLVI